MHILCLDHYDSFTLNLTDWLKRRQKNLTIEVVFPDDQGAIEGLIRKALPLVLSPGPRSPSEATSALRVLDAVVGKAPVLGVCLGAQILGKWAGFDVVRSCYPLHGSTKTIELTTDNSKLFQGVEDGSRVACYHSLVLKEGARPVKAGWNVVARCERGEIMAIEQESDSGWLVAGVQFHPESFLSRKTGVLADNWLRSVREWYEYRDGAFGSVDTNHNKMRHN
ncbi:MAG: gamma-glutamyl-gamma-aminobutyrate hydrolase family protein [Deltaproteobacteria bacterium]|nr:gamma-glutamyl-gamma-aminobutyrate hydrolase family protein [Deltaproteobacteria bacterium]